MKIILHMGQRKTGTTALQLSLGKAEEMLRSRKILYPRSGYVFFAHHLLLALIGCEGAISPWRQVEFGGPEGAAKAARRAWEMTCEEVRRYRPEVLVLSSENLLNLPDAAAKSRLASILSALSTDITPVIYIRHPVDYFRANLQEWMKRHDKPFPPKDLRLKKRILDIEAAFGRPPELVLFDRKSLHGGDTVVDFATRFLAPWVNPAELPTQSANVGLSAEALVLMHRLRTGVDLTRLSWRDIAAMIKAFGELDARDPPSQPFTLLPEVAESALRSATGHRWLSETGRLKIPGLDIDQIDGAPPPDWMWTAPPTSLFLHDPDRLERLQGAFDKHNRESLSASGPSASGNETRATARDFLLRFLHRKLGS